MAGTKRNDLLGRLSDLSEEAVQRLNGAPGAERLMGAMNTLKERTDELQKRVRGLEELEKRLSALERKVDKLAKGGTTGSTTTQKSPKTEAAKKP